MRLLHKDAWYWFNKAKKTRQSAELLIDADAKEVMLELSLFYLGKAAGTILKPDACPVDRPRLVRIGRRHGERAGPDVPMPWGHCSPRVAAGKR
jgi:hypothetical protein